MRAIKSNRDDYRRATANAFEPMALDPAMQQLILKVRKEATLRS